MDIPLDGSVSYFPLTDGSAIITKQLMPDGTSRTLVYKLPESDNKQPKYLTSEDLNKFYEENSQDLQNELKDLKAQFTKLKEAFDKLKSKKE